MKTNVLNFIGYVLNFIVYEDVSTYRKKEVISLYGVTTFIVDLDVRSSFFHACAWWENKSKKSQDYLEWKKSMIMKPIFKTHENSEGSMEVESV